MTDPRLARYADLLCDYSLELKAGDRLGIDAPPAASPLVLALARAAFRRGAEVSLQMEPPGVHEQLLREGTDAQLDHVPLGYTELVEHADAIVGIRAQTNSRALSSVPAARVARTRAARQAARETYQRRAAEGALRWVLCAYPTPGMAQDAQMGTDAFERFVYAACLLDEPDPAAAWQELADRQARLVERLAAASELHVRGPDTDLRVQVGGRPWDSAQGRTNMPDGEVYCSPDEHATEGEIRFALAQGFGRRFEDIRLRFEGGRVVDASAALGEAALLELLETDEGARRLGEFAIGTNFALQQVTGTALFDEKLGGTCHVALGAAFPELGGTNSSALHWDIVCDLRAGGSIEADGEAVVRDGELVP